MDEDSWKGLTADLARIRRKRNALLYLALALGFVGFLLLISARYAWRNNWGPWQWILDGATVTCIGIAILLRTWADHV